MLASGKRTSGRRQHGFTCSELFHSCVMQEYNRCRYFMIGFQYMKPAWNQTFSSFLSHLSDCTNFSLHLTCISGNISKPQPPIVHFSHCYAVVVGGCVWRCWIFHVLKDQHFLAVDKTKQRDGSTRQTRCNGLSQGSMSEGQKQKHQQSSSELVGFLFIYFFSNYY